MREYQSKISELERQLTYDKLTGLLNKDGIQDMLNEAISTCRSKDAPLTIGYVDLKGFKKVNDTIGHEAADQLLIAISQYLQTVTRETDIVSRLSERAEVDEDSQVSEEVKDDLIFRAGGDEFLVAFVGTKREDIEELFLGRLSDENFMGFVKSVMEEDPTFQELLQKANTERGTHITLEDITVGARVGFSELQEEDDAKSLIERADFEQNLARAQQGGSTR